MGALARPTWRIGQVLRPKHLLALEESLSAESARRARAHGLPSYGVEKIDWNGEAPDGGVLYVNGLSAIFPNGTVVDVPDNALIRAPLELGAVGRQPFDVFLHVVDPPDDGKAEEDPLRPSSAETIERRTHDLVLSASPTYLGSRDRLWLGRFALSQGGQIRLAPDTAPPLLRADAWRPLMRRLEALRAELVEIEKKLDGLAADAVNEGRSLASIQRVRIESRKLNALLDDMRGVGLHPYLLFASLRSFSVELSALDETKAPPALAAYDHDKPWPCFAHALDTITRWASWSPPGAPRVPFQPDGLGRLVASLPESARAATEMYVVVLKRDESDRVPFDRVRLASRDRLRIVREYALRGVPFTKDPAPKFRYGFGAGAEFYRLGTATSPTGGERLEWDHVIEESALAFHASPELEGQRFVLCWRRA